MRFQIELANDLEWLSENWEMIMFIAIIAVNIVSIALLLDMDKPKENEHKHRKLRQMDGEDREYPPRKPITDVSSVPKTRKWTRDNS